MIFYDDVSGEMRVGKGPTQPAALHDGVIKVVSGSVPRGDLAAARFFLHGTTIGINALLERKGAVVGLMTTEGFRDVLELRRGERDAIYDVTWKPAAPLVPRRLRLPVRERILADGTIETPLHEEDIEQALRVFLDEDVEAVAVVFLNSHANPHHELDAERCLRKFGFRGVISLSHQVTGEYREYERTSTTVVDAYLRPRVATYLTDLSSSLRQESFSGDLLVTGSGGGAMSFAEAAARPFETIMSGPVAGAVGASELCRELGVPFGISADVGGTSFDTCLIVDGQPQIKYEGRVGGMPLQTPWVDVRSIGAGGGSIAHVDVGGLLRVGPESAGAVPGPACYGRGGRNATVTDAAGILGMLAFGELAGGMRLDFSQAQSVVKPLAERLNLSMDEVARGILRIASANMANAIRSVTVEQGEDPRQSTLIAFGGAGPLFATLLAQELRIPQIVIPKHAGNFSAWGLLGMDVIRSAALTSINRLDTSGVEVASQVAKGLFERLDERRGAAPSAVSEAAAEEAALDLRFVGQEHTLTLDVSLENRTIGEDATSIGKRFARDYERTFGHTLDEPVEIVSIRAVARTPLPREAKERVVASTSRLAHERGSLDAYSFTRGERVSFGVVGRWQMAPGSRLSGPAIVLEETATTYVDAGFEVEVDPSGNLIISDRGAE